MTFHQEYKPQVILASLQSLVIIFGSLVVGTILKTRGYTPGAWELSLKISLIRNYGFLLILIPLTWVCLTIAWERSHTIHFTKRSTIITGSLLILALSYFFLGSAAQCGSSIIQVIE